MSTWKASKLYSILNLKCPRCHEGDLFPKGTLFSPTKFNVMYDACPCCGKVYEAEPGFFYGAMYVSFGLNTLLFLAVVGVLSLFVEEITFTMVITIILIMVVGLLPLNFRYSRAVWMNIFMHYEGPCKEIRKL